MAEGSRVRDPVHNFIDLSEKEVRLVATPLLQRLRRIRQLAMASLVYPGALHTRFGRVKVGLSLPGAIGPGRGQNWRNSPCGEILWSCSESRIETSAMANRR